MTPPAEGVKPATTGAGSELNGDGAPLIYLIVGEPSGDLLGARLMKALQDLTGGQVRFAGIGGSNMAARGLKTLFPISELAIMGIVEAVPHALSIYRRIRQTRAEILRERPAVLVTIDAPSFTLQVSQGLKGKGIPLVHYVAPQVWAWKAWRAKHLAEYLDLLLVLLPFEPSYFEKYGLSTKFVGHPAVEGRGEVSGSMRDTDTESAPTTAVSDADFRERHGIPLQARLVCVLPGSRKGEVTRLGRVFGEGLAQLVLRFPDLHVVVPTVSNVAALVREETGKWSLPVTVIEGSDEKHDAFRACEVALAASGTIAVELAVARLPTLIGYRVNPITAWLASRFLKVKYVSLPNLLLDQPLLTELLQQHLTPAAIASNLAALIEDRALRQRQLDGFARVVALLTPQDESPSRVAARHILEQIKFR